MSLWDRDTAMLAKAAASSYSTAKAGMLGLTKSLGKELAETGVRVNAVTPAARPCCVGFASEECSFSTAATFGISGGRTTY